MDVPEWLLFVVVEVLGLLVLVLLAGEFVLFPHPANRVDKAKRDNPNGVFFICYLQKISLNSILYVL